MYYQTNALSSDGASTSCRIVSSTDNGFLVEYPDGKGNWKETEIEAHQLQKIEYEGQDISQ